MTEFKYNEDKVLKELDTYISSTYNKHYAKNKIQTTEFIFDSGHGVGFCLGNIIKYAQRWGKKDGKNRADLLKMVHYGIILLGMTEDEDETSKEERIRETNGLKYSKSNRVVGASEFFGAKAYNEERGV